MIERHPLISADDLTFWLYRQELLHATIPVSRIIARVRYMQSHGDDYRSQFNPAV